MIKGGNFMSVQVSNCYYHSDKASVATCAKCGVGICKECAVKDEQGRVVCRQCANEESRQNVREYQKLLKARGGRFVTGKDFLFPGIIGILIVIATAIAVALSNDNYLKYSFFQRGLSMQLMMILAGIFLAYTLFSMPFCYLVLNDWIPSYYSTTTLGLINLTKFWFKLLVTIFLGWLVFTFLWVRFLIRKNKNRDNKA